MHRSPHGNGLITLFIKEQYRIIRDDLSGKRFRRKRFVPFMKYREILLLEELLDNLQPKQCLEWGSGYSTLYFPQFLGPEARWLAIEHSDEWAKQVNSLNGNSRVKTVGVPPKAFPWTDEHNDGAYADLADYVDYPGDSAPYDFILVDGRARVECLKRAYEWISDNGVVVLHDAMRPYYHPPLEVFPHQALFKIVGIGDKGLWFGSKGMPIETYLNVARHQRLWHLHNLLRDYKHSRKSTLLQPPKHSKMG